MGRFRFEGELRLQISTSWVVSKVASSWEGGGIERFVLEEDEVELLLVAPSKPSSGMTGRNGGECACGEDEGRGLKWGKQSFGQKRN